MQLISTLAVLLSASVANQALAAPLDKGCAYESDNVHVTCKGDNAGYPRGVDVTYDLGKRFDAELFMRRADALETLARGMDEQRADAVKRADADLTVDPTGDLTKTTVKFSNGTSKPLSDYLDLSGGKLKVDDNDKFTSTHDVSPDGTPQDHSVDNSKSITTNGGGKSIIGLGNHCTVDKNKRSVSCSVNNPKRAVIQARDDYGDSNGGGNVQGSNCNFGNGYIYNRDYNEGGSMICKEYNKRAWLGERDDGKAQGNVCLFGNADVHGGMQRREYNSGAEVSCTKAPGAHPIYGPNAGTTVVGGGNARRQNNKCIHGNKDEPGSQDMTDCEQTTSPIYGPNGGHAIIIARDFDLGSTDDVTAYHNEIRAYLPTSNRNFRRDAEPCDGVPVGPVGPVADYYTRRDIPAAAKAVETQAFTKPRIGTTVKVPNDWRHDGAPAQPRPTPLKRSSTSSATAKRCINTPIAPVGPEVHYHSKSELNNN